MIRFRLKELLADKSFREGRAVTMQELSDATGINRGVLSKIANERGCNTVTDNLDRLCQYFGCTLDMLAEYVPDQEVLGRGESERQVVASGAKRGRSSERDVTAASQPRHTTGISKKGRVARKQKTR